MKQYISFIEKDGKKYGVVFPDFLGCTTVGDSYEDAVKLAHEALSAHVEVMEDNGERIPEPSSLEQIKREWPDYAEWKNLDYTTALIALLPGHETKKYTISMDASLMAKIDAVTRNRSAFLAKAAQKLLESA